MYIIHNKTKNKTFSHEGSWPNKIIENMLNEGNKVIVISLYSNTIKVPYLEEMNGIIEWCWEDFPLLMHHSKPV